MASAGSVEEDVDLVVVAALGDQLLRLQRRRTLVHEGTVLENSAFRVLWVLADGTPRTLRELAADLDLEQSTVNRQVNGAIAAGWLERFEVADSASRLVRPTPAGRGAYEHDARLRAVRYRRALADLGPERSRRLIEDLAAFNDAWDDAAG